MKLIRLPLKKSATSSKTNSKSKAPLTAEHDKEFDVDLFSLTATAPDSKRPGKLKMSPVHPNLRSMCIRAGSRSFSRAMSDTPPLSFIEEPLCAYLSLFDGTKKDMTAVELNIIDNLFSDNFVHIMDGNVPIDKQAFMQINKQLLTQGIVATLEDINFIDEYNVEYTVHWFYTENSSRVTHVSALIADQKIVKLEPCAETRSAFANNMMFSSWKSDDENNDQINGSSDWLGDHLPQCRSSGSSTASSTRGSTVGSIHTTEPAILPGCDQEDKERALAEGEEQEAYQSFLTYLESTPDTLQDNNKGGDKSTATSTVDKELILVKPQGSADGSSDEVDNNDKDKHLTKGLSNSRRSKHPKRRWFGFKGRKTRMKDKSSG